MKSGNVIRILRTASDLTISDVAKKCNVSVPLVSLIEKGERTPSMELLKQLAIVFNIPFSSFLLLFSESEEIYTKDTFAQEIVQTIQSLSVMEIQLRDLISSNETTAD